MLSPYRALDLADEKGYFCGKVLSDLGVDVIKIESPGGDRSRRNAPFYHDIPHQEKSLPWFAFNTNKRSITLNLENATGHDLFLKLAKTADFIIESFPPGSMENLGLDYNSLSKINPRIILTSISPFGQTGPYKDYKITDLTAMALSGLMFMTGDPDRPPLQISVPQAYLHAGLHAASATLIAHYYRAITGEGQWIDVSIHESVVGVSLPVRVYWDFAGIIMPREGSRRHFAATTHAGGMWLCKNGHITFRIFVGPGTGRSCHALTRWMDDEGMAGNMKSLDWEGMDMTKITQQEIDHWENLFSKFFLTHTKSELYEGALERRIMLAPVNTIADILEDEQLAFRNYFVEVEHPELDVSITFPGVPYKSTRLRSKIERRAPLIGEHNEEIYQKEMGLSKAETVALKEANII